MSRLKRTISIILILIMISSVFIVSADDTASYEKDTVRMNKYGLLKALGLYTDDMKMDECDRSFTRGEYARILARFYGVSDTDTVSATPYTDVAAEHKAAAGIVCLTDRGLLSGQADGTFRPDDPITAEQAVKALVIMAGYGEHAKKHGGYPAGYVKMALDTKITKSAAPSGKAMTVGEFTDMLYDMLHADILVETGYSDENFFYRITEGDIVLNHYFDVYIEEGIFNVNGGTTLMGEEKADPGVIKVGNKAVYSNGDYSEFFGRKVSLYYRKSEGKHLDDAVYIDSEDNYNEVITVLSEDIIDTTTAFEFRYYSSSGRNRSVSLPNDANVVVNGRIKPLYSKDDLMPKTGIVKLIDAGGDGIFETVIAESYLTYWVSQVSASDNGILIGDKLGKPAFEINTEDDEVSVIQNGKASSISAITKGNVLLVAADKTLENGVDTEAECYKMILGTETVTGTVTMMDEDTVTIDETEYKVSSDYNQQKYPLKLGMNSIFYLDAYNRVVSASSSTMATYGYLIAAAPTKGINQKLEFKLFDQDGEIKIYKAAESLKIDGYSYRGKNTQAIESLKSAATEYRVKTTFTATNGTGCEQLVQYKLNTDGEITSLDTLLTNKGYNSPEDEGLHFDMLLEGSEASTLYYFAQGKTIAGRVFFSDSLPFFNIPSDLDKEKDYRIGSMGDYPGEKITSYLAVFDSDEFFRAKVIVTPAGGSGSLYYLEIENMMVVDGFKSVRNSNDEFVKGITGVRISDGSRITVIPDKSERVDEAKLEKGDIVRWTENTSGEAVVIERTLSPYDDDGTFLGENGEQKHDFAWYTNVRIAVGRAVATDGELIKLHYAASKLIPPANTEVNYLSRVERVLVYDRKVGEIRIGTLMDLETDKDLGEGKGNRVFTYQDYNAIKWMVIFK